MESKETTQEFILFDKGEVAPSTEIHERVELALEEFKGVGHDKCLEILPPMRGIQHHDTFVHHDFKDPFVWEESARHERFKFFKFMLPTIGIWAQRKHGPTLSYMDCDEDFRDKPRLWDQTLPQVEFMNNNTVRGSKNVQEEV